MYINRFDTLLGYEKTLKPMRAARVSAVLHKRYRYSLSDNNNSESKEVLAEAEFIVYALQTGYKPEPYNEYPCSKCIVRNCIGRESCNKVKTTYYMSNGKFSTKISKTGYSFAKWLMSEGLTTFDAVQERISMETAEAEALKHKAADLEQQNQSAAIAERQADENHTQWLREAIRNYGGLNTPEGEKILIQRDVWLDILGTYDDAAKGLLVLIDNIDKPLCRRDLISRLHNGNVASIKTFECITGIKLAKTYKARKTQLEQISTADYVERPKQYKPRVNPNKIDYNTPFYICNIDGKFVEAAGRLWQYNGYDFYIQKDSKRLYKATEGRSGILVTDSCPTLENLYGSVKNIMAQMGDKFGANIQQKIERNGLSPLYTNQSDV